MALSSCVEDAIKPLEGKYEKPVTYELNTLVDQSVEKGDNNRIFTVEVADQNASLKMKFVGDKYYLADESYTASPEAKKGTYLVGEGGSTFTKGGSTLPVESGTLVVKQENGTYNMSGTLWLADESAIKIVSSVALVYEADPEPVVLKQVLSATSNVASGTNSLTINLGTDDISSTTDPTTWQTVWTGTGNYLALDIYSADGYLHEGTYTACAVGGTINEGEFGIGWDPGDLWGIGMVFENWGTCWWDVANGAAVVNQKVTEGTVTVSKKGNKWIIELISGEGKAMLWTKFEGAIEALTPSDSATPTPAYTMTEKVEPVYDQSYAVVAGVEKHTVTLSVGEDVAAIFELLTAEGGDIAGVYECQEYASAPGLMGNGYSIPEWNVEGGSRYWVNGEMVLINAGETLEVTKYAEGLYGFTGSTGYEFIAAAEGYVAGGGDEPSGDYVELSSFLSLTSYLGYGINMVGVELGTEGFTYSYDATTYQPVYGVDGNYLKLELYSADGTVAPGTYTACAVGGTVGEGEFGIGYDGMWGASGTTWYTVAGGVATYQYIADGTVTVEVSGDEYTVTVESSLVNAQFVGTFAQ